MLVEVKGSLFDKWKSKVEEEAGYLCYLRSQCCSKALLSRGAHSWSGMCVDSIRKQAKLSGEKGTKK